jgi:hypothetical protein
LVIVKVQFKEQLKNTKQGIEMLPITKAIGDKDALRVARWIFNQTPLDA